MLLGGVSFPLREALSKVGETNFILVRTISPGSVHTLNISLYTVSRCYSKHSI